MTALERLTIEGLRGSVREFSLPFEKGKGVTIIYGENGTGKSTICDAFEFIGKGTVGSLDGRGLGKTTVYWPSMDRGLTDISVKLESAAGTCEARVGTNGTVVATPETLRPAVEIFRRRQILGPIEAAPAARYEAIKRFIDVSNVEVGESALRGLIKELKERQEVAAARVLENLEEIERLWNTAGKPGGAALAWAEAEATRDSATLDAEAKSIDSLHLSYKRLETHPERFASAMDVLARAQTQAAAAAETVREQLAAIASDAGEVVAILESAQPYLARSPSPEACPLCESSERTDGLGIRVEARLRDFRALREVQATARAAEASEVAARERLSAQREAATLDSRAFEVTRTSCTWPADIALPQDAAPEDASLIATWLAGTASLASGWEAARDGRRASLQSQASLKRALANWRTNKRTAEEIVAILPHLEAALEVAEEERRAFADEALSEISDEVGRLYDQIHPGEGLGKIALELDPKRRASLGIEAAFHGKEAKPQAYFSDSHLDTLGLCVLLALASKEKPGEKILVLDDVLASADEPHVDRLIQVLYAEAAKFRHCVLTTHYRPWKEKLRWGLLKTGDCHLVELSRWSIASGITLTGSIPEIERLRRLLAEAAPDLQSVCAKAGVILEAALDFLTRLYECRVPRRSSGLTLGDLIGGVDKKLRAALRVDVRTSWQPDGTPIYTTVQLGPLLDDLTTIAQARNLFGCHFNELSFDLIDSDALRFGRSVVEIGGALVDLEDGWPKSNKSGSYWATSGEARRLHPLLQPK